MKKMFSVNLVYLSISLVCVTLCLVIPLKLGLLLFPSVLKRKSESLDDSYLIYSRWLTFYQIPERVLQYIKQDNLPAKSIIVFTLRILELLCIDEQLLLGNVFTMRKVTRNLQLLSTTLRHQHARAFEEDLSRLRNLRAVKEALDVAEAAYIVLIAAAEDGDRRRLLSMCALNSIASNKTKLIMQLNELKLRRDYRSNFVTEAVTKYFNEFNRIEMNEDTEKHCLSEVCAAKTACQCELLILRYNDQLLDDADAGCRFDDAPEIAATVDVFVEAQLGSLFSSYLQLHGFNSSSEKVRPMNFPVCKEDESSEVIMGVDVGSMADKRNLLRHDALAIDDTVSNQHFTSSEMMSILISQVEENEMTGKFIASEVDLFSHLNAVESAFTTCLAESHQRADDAVAHRSTLSILLVPFEIRCLLFLCICCLTLLITSTVVIHVSAPIGRYCYICLGWSDTDLSVDIFLGMGVIFLITVATAYIRRCLALVLLDADFISIVFKVCRLTSTVLKILLVASVQFFLIPISLGVFGIFVGKAFSKEMNETPFLPMLLAWAVGMMILYFCYSGILGKILFLSEWCEKVDRVIQMRFGHLDILFIVKEVVYPVITVTADLLVVPYALGKSATLTVEDYGRKSYIMRYCFLYAFICAVCCRWLTVLSRQVLKALNERPKGYLLEINLSNKTH